MGKYYLPPKEDVTVAPYRRTVGHEVEFSTGRTLATQLLKHRLTPQNGMPIHSSHCRCAAADNYPLHAVFDSSANGGEYHIGGNSGVLFGSPAYREVIRLICAYAHKENCGTSTAVGLHTHVGLTNPDTGAEITDEQKVELLRIYLRYEDQIHHLSCGPLDEPRDNGHTPKHLDWGFWTLRTDRDLFWEMPAAEVVQYIRFPGKATLNMQSPHGTIEFRIWNATKAPWRIYLAGAISTAMVEAVAQGRTLQENPAPTLMEFLEGLLTPDVLALCARQLTKQTLEENKWYSTKTLHKT